MVSCGVLCFEFAVFCEHDRFWNGRAQLLSCAGRVPVGWKLQIVWGLALRFASTCGLLSDEASRNRDKLS